MTKRLLFALFVYSISILGCTDNTNNSCASLPTIKDANNIVAALWWGMEWHDAETILMKHGFNFGGGIGTGNHFTLHSNLKNNYSLGITFQYKEGFVKPVDTKPSEMIALDGLVMSAGIWKGNSYYQDIKLPGTPNLALQWFFGNIYSFADSLDKMSSKYPEFADYNKSRAVDTSEYYIRCIYIYNYKTLTGKTPAQTTDFDKNGIFINLTCEILRDHVKPQSSAAPIDIHEYSGHRIGVWAEFYTSGKPTNGMIDEIRASLRKNLSELLHGNDKHEVEYLNNADQVSR